MPKAIKQQFTHCLTGKSTGLSDILNINGYYESVVIGHWQYGYGKSFEEGDSTFLHIIFYDDGTCYDAQEVFHTKGASEARMNTLGQDKDSLWFYEGDMWGIYKLYQDTIVIQRIRRAHSANDHWSAGEYKYLILNRSTIRFLDYSRSLHRQPHAKAFQGEKEYPTATFIRHDQLPRSNSWIKRDRSFYCK